jgi:hypothetical protein
MFWTLIAVGATVLAAAVRIDAGIETNVGTVVVSNNAFGRITKKLGPNRGIFGGVPIFVAR